MKKRLMALVIAAIMTVSVFGGCGKQETKSNENASSQTAEKEGTGETEKELEIITIDHLALNLPAYNETFEVYLKDSPVYKEFIKQTGIELAEYGLDKDQTQIRIASGDLGDLITVTNYNDLVAMIESDLLLPLNELVEEYAPNIMNEYVERWDNACTLYPNKENLAYALPVRAGKEGYGSDASRYLFRVRWDLYKELGMPTLETPEDMIKFLTDCVKLYPTTEDGKKVYGTSFFLTSTSFQGLTNLFQGTYGLINMKGHYITRDIRKDKLVYEVIDEDSAYWKAVDFFNQAYLAGILDPDSFTQTSNDMRDKMTAGQLLHLSDSSTSYYSGWTSTFQAKDPTATKGFVPIPVEGYCYYSNTNQINGWAHYVAIPKTCKNPDRVMQMLAYTFSEDGSRMLLSGVQGLHWDYVNGVPTYTDEAYKMSKTDTEAWNKTGIQMTPISNFAGMGSGEVHSDGYIMQLSKEADYKSRDLKPTAQDYCEYYKVSYPLEALINYKKAGKMEDLSEIDFRPALNVSDEDISRIDSACVKIAIEAVPKLVAASSRDEFARVKAETLKALEAAGAKEAQAYYTKVFNEELAKYAK